LCDVDINIDSIVSSLVVRFLWLWSALRIFLLVYLVAVVLSDDVNCNPATNLLSLIKRWRSSIILLGFLVTLLLLVSSLFSLRQLEFTVVILIEATLDQFRVGIAKLHSLNSVMFADPHLDVFSL
jgi:hypothetical protein